MPYKYVCDANEYDHPRDAHRELLFDPDEHDDLDEALEEATEEEKAEALELFLEAECEHEIIIGELDGYEQVSSMAHLPGMGPAKVECPRCGERHTYSTRFKAEMEEISEEEAKELLEAEA